MNEKDSERNPEEATEMVEDGTSPDEIIADAGEPVEQSVEADETAEPDTTEKPVETSAPVETAQPVQTAEPDTTEKPVETKKPVETAQPTTAPAKQTTEPSVPAQTEQTVTQSTVPTPAPTPVATPTPEPVHEHSWKEHVVTTPKVWVSNIVVTDYETQYVQVGSNYVCSCDFETTDPDVLNKHLEDSFQDGDTYDGGNVTITFSHNFGIYPIYEYQQIYVGPHEEDQGYSATFTYTDYYYCD